MLVIRVPKQTQAPRLTRVLQWYRQEGDAIGRGVVLVDLQIDLKTVSLPCSGAGIIERLLVKPGEVVEPDQPLAVIKDSLPVFDGDADLEMDQQYSPAEGEFTVSTQVEIQQMLADKASEYANRIQSLPPKWESDPHGMGRELDNRLQEHPAFADKACARKEEYRHPSDIPNEHLDKAELRYNNEYQHQPGFNPAPRAGG